MHIGTPVCSPSFPPPPAPTTHPTHNPPTHTHLQVTLLDFAPAHASSYNALVEVIRRNLLLADWCDDTHTEVRGGGRYSTLQYSTLQYSTLQYSTVL